MDFHAELDKLQERAAKAATAAREALAEDQLQRQQRIERAQVDLDLAAKDARQKVEETSDKAERKWSQMRSDAAAKVGDVKARAHHRAAQLDAKVAENDAEWAEIDALDALDYADWAVDNAALAVLDAIDARARANDLSGAAES